MTTIQESLAKLQAEQDAKQAELDRLKRLAEKYPDLQKHIGRWEKVAYYSKIANTQATRFDMRHNCGCCSDSPLELWPYMETPDGNIYTDPPMFTIGEREGLGDRPYDGWKRKLQNAGLPESLIGACEVYFERHRDDDP